MKDCREVRELLSDFRDGTLPEAVGDGISRHLLECAACAGVDRSLLAVRDRLRNLPPVPAPPELLAGIRDAVAREARKSRPARSAFSRWMVPLEAAAALLLFASVYWYWSGSATAPGKPSAPAEIASAGPAATAAPSPAREVLPPSAVSPPPPRIARTAPRAATAALSAGPAAEPERERGSISTLPEDTPDPKERVYTIADLPAVPVLRASTNFRRIAPAVPRDAETEARTAAEGGSQPSRIHMQIPYGRTVSLDVAQEEREDAGNRIGQTAMRLGGTVEGTDRVVPDGIVAVRVLLPERTARNFIEELSRIGEIPPDGMPKRSVLPAGPTPGTIAYSVRLRAK